MSECISRHGKKNELVKLQTKTREETFGEHLFKLNLLNLKN